MIESFVWTWMLRAAKVKPVLEQLLHNKLERSP